MWRERILWSSQESFVFFGLRVLCAHAAECAASHSTTTRSDWGVADR